MTVHLCPNFSVVESSSAQMMLWLSGGRMENEVMAQLERDPKEVSTEASHHLL